MYSFVYNEMKLIFSYLSEFKSLSNYNLIYLYP